MKCTTGLRPDEFAGLLIRLRDEAVRDCPACRSWDAMRSLRMMHADMPHSLSQEVIDDSSGACRRWGAGSGRVARGRGRPRRVVRCASSRLLRLFLSAALLHPPLRLFFSYSGGSRGAADAGADGPAVIDVHGATVPLTSSAPLAPPVSPRTRTDRRAAWSGDSERRPARIFPPPPRGSHHHHTPARTLVRKAQYSSERPVEDMLCVASRRG